MRSSIRHECRLVISGKHIRHIVDDALEKKAWELSAMERLIVYVCILSELKLPGLRV